MKLVALPPRHPVVEPVVRRVASYEFRHCDRCGRRLWGCAEGWWCVTCERAWTAEDEAWRSLPRGVDTATGRVRLLTEDEAHRAGLWVWDPDPQAVVEGLE